MFVHRFLRSSLLMAVAIIALLSINTASNHQQYNNLPGIYPGNPAEDFAPTLQADKSYRNLALNRAAFHSSSYDYNLTAQLLADGLITPDMPNFINLSSNHGDFLKNEKERVLDHVTGSGVSIDGDKIWLQFEIGGSDMQPEITMSLENADTRGNRPVVQIEGFNVN